MEDTQGQFNERTGPATGITEGNVQDTKFVPFIVRTLKVRRLSGVIQVRMAPLSKPEFTNAEETNQR